MNNSILRTILILLHAVLNFLIVNRLMNYDLTAGWLRFAGFLLLMVLLLYLFILHLISYINLIKTKTT